MEREREGRREREGEEEREGMREREGERGWEMVWYTIWTTTDDFPTRNGRQKEGKSF